MRKPALKTTCTIGASRHTWGSACRPAAGLPRSPGLHAPENIPEDSTINRLILALVACGFSLSACQGIGADAQDSHFYCGKILWPAQREDYLPFPEGMDIDYSSHPSLAQALLKQEKHSIRFAYEDMSISYRLIRETVDMIIRLGTNAVCLEAATLETSDSEIPLTVSPMASADDRVILESAPGRNR